jgi:hypothetical protein
MACTRGNVDGVNEHVTLLEHRWANDVPQNQV